MKIFLKSDLFNYSEEEFVSSAGSGEGVLVLRVLEDFLGLTQNMCVIGLGSIASWDQVGVFTRVHVKLKSPTSKSAVTAFAVSVCGWTWGLETEINKPTVVQTALT